MSSKAAHTITDVLAHKLVHKTFSLHDITTAILDALQAAGIELVELPEPKPGWWGTYQEDGEDPDHNYYSDEHSEFYVTTWHHHPNEVQVSHQGEPLEPISPAEARALAAALLAAARAAEEQS